MYSRIVLNTEETLPNFVENVFMLGLLGDVSPMCRSYPRLGRDKVGINALG